MKPGFRAEPDGWLAGARHAPSPNADDRPAGVTVDLLVLHDISLPPGVFGNGLVEALFTGRLPTGVDPFVDALQGLRVSAHLLVARDGSVTQFVPLHRRAWHAGRSHFAGRDRCNDFSVGIELEGTDFGPFTTAQYDALAGLSRALRAALPLAAARGHCHVAADRKTDPGPFFDWPRFGREGGWPAAALPPTS